MWCFELSQIYSYYINNRLRGLLHSRERIKSTIKSNGMCVQSSSSLWMLTKPNKRRECCGKSRKGKKRNRKRLCNNCERTFVTLWHFCSIKNSVIFYVLNCESKHWVVDRKKKERFSLPESFPLNWYVSLIIKFHCEPFRPFELIATWAGIDSTFPKHNFQRAIALS